MKMSLQRAMLLALCCVGLPVVAHAADSSLVLVMGGEAYDGPPKFEVDFAGKVLGDAGAAQLRRGDAHTEMTLAIGTRTSVPLMSG